MAPVTENRARNNPDTLYRQKVLETLDDAFNAGQMVSVDPSHADIRGIPFYRAKINGSPVEAQGEAAAFRHGTMRVACN